MSLARSIPRDHRKDSSTRSSDASEIIDKLMKDVNGAGRSIEERFSLDRFVFCRISKINFVNLIYAREYILRNPFIEILKWIILSKILRSSTILNRQIFFCFEWIIIFMTRIKIKFVIKSYAILPCLVFASIF